MGEKVQVEFQIPGLPSLVPEQNQRWRPTKQQQKILQIKATSTDESL